MNGDQPLPETAQNRMGGYSDTAIFSKRDDQFGFQDYAEVLARRTVEADTPLTIGVYGRWGSGKTSLMRLIEAEVQRRGQRLKTEPPAGATSPIPAGSQIETLWINVWKLSNQEQLWNAFLQALLTQVHESLKWYRRLAFDWSLFKERVRWRSLWQNLLVNSYRILVTVTPILLSTLAPDQAVTGSGDLLALALDPLTGGGASLILALWLLVRPAVQAAKEKVSLDLGEVLKEAPYAAQVSALQQLEKQFERMVNGWVGDAGRLVIFIDDLDRCTPDKVPEVMEAIKLFTTTRRCVYVIGLDHDIVRQGIRARYNFASESEAAEYLEKIVQIPFFLPPLDEGRIEVFLRGYYQELERLSPTAADVFAAGLEPNPRRVKRALNIYRTLLDLADVRVKAWEMDPVDPELVAKMVVIESRFRRLHQYLVKEPAFLLQLEEKALAHQLDYESLQKDEAVGRPLLGGTPALVDENSLEPLADMLRAGQRHFGDDDQRTQISSYIYLIATTEGTTTEQVRPNREEREDLLASDRDRIRARVAQILSRHGEDESTRQHVGQIYIERLERVLEDDLRYTPDEQAAAQFALAWLEVSLLGDTEESIRYRLESVLPPEVMKMRYTQQQTAQQKMAQTTGPTLSPEAQMAYDRLLRRLQTVIEEAGAFDSRQVVVANLALDLVEDGAQLDFEPQTVRLSAGPFLMGSTAEQVRDAITAGLPGEVGEAEQPQHEVTLDAYRLGRYPVTNLQYQAFVSDTGHSPPAHWKNGSLPADKANHPVTHVSWEDAQAYCSWLSRQLGQVCRLPSEAEWEKAARGTDGRLYPWGNEWDPARCNVEESGLGDTSPVGHYSPEGDSPFGAADMAGNVWEWTGSLWGKDNARPNFGYPYTPDDGREEADAAGLRVLRGGAFNGQPRHVRCAVRSRRTPDTSNENTGFRVVVSPIAPASYLS